MRDRWGAGDGEGGGKEAGEAEEETKKTLGELGMAASGPASAPDLGFREVRGWGGTWA